MSSKFPKHVAIIMDGNGRWAKKRGLPRFEGHQAGAKAVRATIEYACEQGIEVLTLFALSVENYLSRPTEEVEFLLALLLETLQENTDELHSKNIRVQVIGDRSVFQEGLLDQIEKTEAKTNGNSGMTLVLAINYSGRWDITHAARKLAELVAQDNIKPADIDETQFSKYLCLADFPEPDLFIRTSGELRISNFMLWQFAYTELFFSEEFWPDFSNEVFQQALDAYAERERRYGLISEQKDLQSA